MSVSGPSSVSFVSVSYAGCAVNLLSTGIKLLLFLVSSLSFLSISEVSMLLVSGIKLLTVLDGFVSSLSSSSEKSSNWHKRESGVLGKENR